MVEGTELPTPTRRQLDRYLGVGVTAAEASLVDVEEIGCDFEWSCRFDSM